MSISTIFPRGMARWITVVSPEEPNASYPAVRTLKEALVRDGIPFTAFQVSDIQAEYERLRSLGVEFTAEPTDVGTSTMAVFDDTCANLIQIFQLNA